GPTSSECPDSLDLNPSNRPVRTRMPGGVAGVRSHTIAPYADCLICSRNTFLYEALGTISSQKWKESAWQG
ncbi:hypothetical protein ACDY96_10190, partial [Rhizobium mongolense]|uniref:hypothetical protein n=1 Tax=Rhizobium mongolense TaxID=57676 RepID=UPI003556F36B